VTGAPITSSANFKKAINTAPIITTKTNANTIHPTITAAYRRSGRGHSRGGEVRFAING
jgi:hypothetical protein